MIDKLIGWAVRNRGAVLFGILALIASGVWALRTLRVDAFPDLTDVQVQILVEAPGLSPVGGGAAGDGAHRGGDGRAAARDAGAVGEQVRLRHRHHRLRGRGGPVLRPDPGGGAAAGRPRVAAAGDGSGDGTDVLGQQRDLLLHAGGRKQGLDGAAHAARPAGQAAAAHRPGRGRGELVRWACTAGAGHHPPGGAGELPPDPARRGHRHRGQQRSCGRRLPGAPRRAVHPSWTGPGAGTGRSRAYRHPLQRGGRPRVGGRRGRPWDTGRSSARARSPATAAARWSRDSC